MAQAILAESLGKRYRKGGQEAHFQTFREALLHRLTPRPRSAAKAEEFWALRNVSFAVDEGEAVGIIGRNGAGKSTLLKLLARVTSPTEGRAILRGRVGSLLEVGTGFHPELTGRENIFLSTSILGMPRSEARRRFDEIVAFSEVGTFLDTPVKHYSSGMYVRLAFSVAVHLDPEILLIDEVLAVGDVAFQRRSLSRIHQLVTSGRTVLFVSHNLAHVQNLCKRAILIDHNTLLMAAPVEESIQAYLKLTSGAGHSEDLRSRRRPPGLAPVIQRVTVRNKDGQASSSILCGDLVQIELEYAADMPLEEGCFALTFMTPLGVKVFWAQSRMQGCGTKTLPPRGCVRCTIPRLPLVPGMYVIDAGCGTQVGQIDFVPEAASVQILPADRFGTGVLPRIDQALVLVDSNWDL
ncbi:MAG TPA: ABC transporter ATP-binding protein [Polyangia bacterium]|jgi:ABC-type polysaccharide/polyol phosphate transport system, ATPase component|nr:ABC transporter ATP-binding protein [Polyangia bacterium]